MATIDTIIHLLSALLPCISVLGFLLIHRRQAIQADLEDTRLRQTHRQLLAAGQTKRTESLGQAAIALAPAIMQLVERTFPRPDAAKDLSDQELVAELDRRIDEHDWKHGNPFAALDELLERLWSEGVDIPQPRTSPPTTPPLIPNLRAEVS